MYSLPIDLAMKDIQLDFMNLFEYVRITNIDDDIFYEDGEEKTGFSKFIDNVIHSFQAIVQKAASGITNLLTKKKFKDDLEDLTQEVKKRPKLRKKKIEMTDYDILEKLNHETASAIRTCRNAKEIEAKMKKYRKQRNKLLAGGALVTTALGTFIYMSTMKHEESIKKLKEERNFTSLP